MNSQNPVWYPEFSPARNVVSQESSWGYSASDKTGFGGFVQRQTTMGMPPAMRTDWGVAEGVD